MPTYSSTFDGSEDPLSEGGTWASIPSIEVPLKSSGVVSARSLGVEAWARYTVTLDNDQSSEITISLLSVVGLATVMTRVSGNTGYFGYWIQGATCAIYRVDGLGITTQIAGPVAVVFSAGHRLKLSSVGNLHTLYDNDSVVLSVTDSTYTSGSVGIGLYDGTALADTAITAWTGISTPTVSTSQHRYVLTGSRYYS